MSVNSHWSPLIPTTDLVYGPVTSRRLGQSLGINLLGTTKICSYDCPYCELGLTKITLNFVKKEYQFPTLSEIDNQLRTQLRDLVSKKATINYLTLSGNGEPTLYSEFAEAVEILIKARDDLLPKVPLAILTSGAHLDNKKVVTAMNRLDERFVKFDAGSDNLLKRVNSPLVRVNVSKLISGARKLKDCVIQSLFHKGVVDNTTNEAIDEWIEVIGMVNPKQVQIYTLDREPANSAILKADEDTLYTIASKLKRRSSVESIVFS